MTREILYERNVTGSYMKVPMALDGELDEKILLRKSLPGLLPMEKIFVNQGAWYWYNISGKQSLDHYCRARNIDGFFFERIVIGICREIENMKQNYLSPNCLVLDSEYIFISNQTQEIVFMAYPGEKQPLEKALQLLVEYLLTKIDHKDVEAVRKAYEIYERTLNEAYTIEEIRDCLIVEKREEQNEESTKSFSGSKETETEIIQPEMVRQKGLWIKPEHQKVQPENNIKFEQLIHQLQEWKKCLKKLIPSWCIREKKETPSIVVMPEDLSEEEEEKIPETIHPTICLTDYREHPRGILLYEGMEEFNNILLNGTDQQIGKSKEATVCIHKDTISNIHAGIWFEEQEYYLEDYNSTNGTYVNNEPLAYKERRKLQCNDIVRFADVKYRFV